MLYSAAKSDGAVRRLLQLLMVRGHECWVDDYFAVEARRNLGTKGPDALGTFEYLLATLNVGSAQAFETVMLVVSWLPEKDRPVLAAAIH